MAHIWNLMLELGSLQSTLNALDLWCQPGSCVFCILCQVLWAQHMVALDNSGYGALIRSKHTAPYYRHVAWFGFKKPFPPCWIKSILENFNGSICSLWPCPVSWNWAVCGLRQAWNSLQLENHWKNVKIFHKAVPIKHSVWLNSKMKFNYSIQPSPTICSCSYSCLCVTSMCDSEMKVKLKVNITKR